MQEQSRTLEGAKAPEREGERRGGEGECVNVKCCYTAPMFCPLRRFHRSVNSDLYSAITLPCTNCTLVPVHSTGRLNRWI